MSDQLNETKPFKLQNPHQLELEQVFEHLQSSLRGLDSQEAKRRLQLFGANQIQAVARQSLLIKFLKQFTHLFALMLWIAVALCFLAAFLSPKSDMLPIGIAILGVILINGIFSFIQEYKAEQTLSSLRKLLPEQAQVLRESKLNTIMAPDLVPGDVVILREGDKVPADLRLIETQELMLNLSSLTGESAAVSVASDASQEANPMRAGNLAFSGTYVVKGHGKGIVYATGMQSEYGKIASLTQSIKPELGHIQSEIRHTSKIISMIALVMGALFFVLGAIKGLDLWFSAVFALGIIVANVPEGLLPTVTLSLAIGTRRMAQNQFFIRDLNVIENLGAITVIASDKTGTITQNKMTVTGLFDNQSFCLPSQPIAENTGLILGLCHNLLNGEADPTEVAIGNYISQKFALEELANRYPRQKEYPFDYYLRRMSVVHQAESGPLVLTKGAFYNVLEISSQIELNGQLMPLDEQIRQRLETQYQEMGRNGYRILGLAYKACLDLPASRVEAENDLVFVGMIAMMDPPREEVHDAVQRCKKAGIRVVMITGDSPFTAGAIARQVGIIQDEADVMTGQELDQTSEADLQLLLRNNYVFAMITPEHKLRVVNTLKTMGEIVAVTGDGVNDAPALRRADVGIAMGSGTDVAKEVASAVLLDDHFATIIKGIEEGRAVFGNIRKFITYILASNVPEIVPYIVFFLWNMPLALTVPLILAIDLGSDLLPALALGTERPESDLMMHPPRSRTERLLNPALFLRAYGFLGVLEAIIAMGIFWICLHLYQLPFIGQSEPTDPAYQLAMTMTFAAIIFAQIGNGFACRSETESIFKIGFLSNRFYLYGIAYEIVFLLMLTEWPLARSIFSTQPLDLQVLLWLLLIPPALLACEELRKWIQRKRLSKILD